MRATTTAPSEPVTSSSVQESGTAPRARRCGLALVAPGVSSTPRWTYPFRGGDSSRRGVQLPLEGTHTHGEVTRRLHLAKERSDRVGLLQHGQPLMVDHGLLGQRRGLYRPVDEPQIPSLGPTFWRTCTLNRRGRKLLGATAARHADGGTLRSKPDPWTFLRPATGTPDAIKG